MHSEEVSIQEGQFENVLAVAFAPVVALSELIKNSSDACTARQDTIKIYIDSENNIIRLIDNGFGFSVSDIDNLSKVSFSTKMKAKNTLSRIGEPFAGSKGLGILTAFNLCETLEIFTFSQEDQKAYTIVWKKGTRKISWEEIERKTAGTELVLHGVSSETIQLIMMEEELLKLYLSSINYYVDSKTLPRIELYEGKNRNVLTPETKIDNLYGKFKREPKTGGFFIAKASFRYSQNKLTLSYEDNLKGLYNFENQEIDIANISSVLEFLRVNKISNANLRDVVANFDGKTSVDDFEGVYYIWRGRKHNDIDYPYGVRIYINNYGLYNYLNKGFDWLQHSEISQNVKATNYKLKNTYGYVAFKNYNEENSSLKISNERNDFHENLAKKKFLYIMQNFVSAIFSTIDINIKNFDKPDSIKFKRRVDKKTITIGDSLRIKDHLIITNLSLEEINIAEQDNVVIDSDGNISFAKVGRYKFSFEYEEETIDVEVHVEEDIPYFELKKTSFSVQENNTIDLRDYIKKASVKNLDADNIEIYSDKAHITGGSLFSAKNVPGKYNIHYKYSEDLIKTAQLTVMPAHSKSADKLKELFPNACKKCPKITDIIYAISDGHVRHPTLCMVAIRVLIEISLRAFINEFYSKEEKEKFAVEKDFAIQGKLSGLFNKIHLNQLPGLDASILDQYKHNLTKTRKTIEKNYESLELNLYVHDQNMHATDKEVSQSLKQFHQLLNFIIDSLNSKAPIS